MNHVGHRLPNDEAVLCVKIAAANSWAGYGEWYAKGEAGRVWVHNTPRVKLAGCGAVRQKLGRVLGRGET